MNKTLLIILFAFTVSATFGQTDSLSMMQEIDTTVNSQDLEQAQKIDTDSTRVDTIGVDTSGIAGIAIRDTTLEKQDSIVGFFNIFKGEPGKAALYSLVIPGGGQIYNRKWVKAPVIILADAVGFGIAIYWTGRYKRYNIEYTKSVNGLPNLLPNWSDSALISQRNTLRKYRDYSWFAAGIVHLVTVVEAFVDRHLLEFDMNEDLSLELISIKDPYSVTLASVNYTF